MSEKIEFGYQEKNGSKSKETLCWNTYMDGSMINVLFNQISHIRTALENMPKEEKMNIALTSSSAMKQLHESKGLAVNVNGVSVGNGPNDIRHVLYMYKISHCLEYAKKKKKKVHYENPFAPKWLKPDNKLYYWYNPSLYLRVDENCLMVIVGLLMNMWLKCELVPTKFVLDYMYENKISIKKLIKEKKAKFKKLVSKVKMMKQDKSSNDVYLAHLSVKYPKS